MSFTSPNQKENLAVAMCVCLSSSYYPVIELIYLDLLDGMCVRVRMNQERERVAATAWSSPSRFYLQNVSLAEYRLYMTNIHNTNRLKKCCSRNDHFSLFNQVTKFFKRRK